MITAVTIPIIKVLNPDTTMFSSETLPKKIPKTNNIPKIIPIEEYKADDKDKILKLDRKKGIKQIRAAKAGERPSTSAAHIVATRIALP